MGILELVYKRKKYTDYKTIIKILKDEKFYWLIDSEVSDAIIEIDNDTILWHSGNFMVGIWKYGIFKNGGFYGIWENGIFENGYFKGEWVSGIDLSKK